MGYGVGIRPGNPKLKKTMMAFLGRHLVPFGELVPDKEGCVRGPTDTLAYMAGDKHIEFNFSAGGDEGLYYMINLLNWMAKQIGSKAKIKGRLQPYINYDGCEKWPIKPFTFT